MAILKRPSNIIRAPLVRPKLNVNLKYDMQNGRMVLGRNGQWILNGGQAALTSIGGRGNTWKSTFQRINMMHAFVRYALFNGFMENIDSEFSVDPYRTADLMCNFDDHERIDILEELERGDESQYNITDNTEQTGDYWWGKLVNDLEERATKSHARDKLATPFLDYDGSPICILPVWLFDLDSTSQLAMASTLTQQAKGDAGSSEQQTIWMRDAGAKAQMITQMSYMLPRGGAYLSMTAHLDDSIKLDQYAPSNKKLAGLKGDLKFKGVPGRQITFLPASCYIATAEGPLLDGNKEPMYGTEDRISLKGDTDLKIVRYEQLRGKGGATGMVLDYIYSQQEGMQEELSMWYDLHRVFGGYGMAISGNKVNFSLHLYPELSVTRNSLRKHIRTNRRFRRAIELTWMMAFETHFWHMAPPEYKMEPSVLYTMIKDKGYCWNDILDNSVYWWHFNDDERFAHLQTIVHRTLIDVANGKHEAT
ncbi:MAG: hypothetical protein ACRCUB_18835, partial [Plesiomonas shigelloides]